jgi:hypothetical protein
VPEAIAPKAALRPEITSGSAGRHRGSILTVSGGLVLTVSYPRAIFNETARRHWPRKSKNLASSRGNFQAGDDVLRERLAHPWNFTSHRPHNYHALLPQIPGLSIRPAEKAPVSARIDGGKKFCEAWRATRTVPWRGN